MRYFDIQITDDNGTLIKQFTSLTPQGTFNPGAPMIEVDIQRYGLSTPKGMSLLRVWGPSITDIRQATRNYANKNISISLGMSAGLPLANPKQAGLAIQGIIQQPFGNWQGTEQSLDFLITAGYGSNSEPKNIVLQWSAGQKMSTALFFSLQRAFPDWKITINISDNLVTNYDNNGFYNTLSQLAQQIKILSKSIITTPNYAGVEMATTPGEIRVWDGSETKTPTQLQFVDLVGQPTWIEAQKVSIKLVMRADIQTGDYIRMPAGSLSVTTAASYAQYRDQSSFTGDMMVTDVRLVGNSRQPDGNSWVTILEAVPV
ncbi:hypothetical protein PQD17_gp18 [Pantoea phage PdC23]|uniref:Uncharacterized protein n=1 Tax=Pantoea phage PdC23 TaxID=2894356 RepID=A0AAE9C882_9CAUD|nr:hypothetical protein PQD17_gp18 [Pantoea phage PdC23]UGC97731.1 hypothetical protein pdc_018 [Pantoea phage PdC23]